MVGYTCLSKNKVKILEGDKALTGLWKHERMYL